MTNYREDLYEYVTSYQNFKIGDMAEFSDRYKSMNGKPKMKKEEIISIRIEKDSYNEVQLEVVLKLKKYGWIDAVWIKNKDNMIENYNKDIKLKKNKKVQGLVEVYNNTIYINLYDEYHFTNVFNFEMKLEGKEQIGRIGNLINEIDENFDFSYKLEFKNIAQMKDYVDRLEKSYQHK